MIGIQRRRVRERLFKSWIESCILVYICKYAYTAKFRVLHSAITPNYKIIGIGVWSIERFRRENSTEKLGMYKYVYANMRIIYNFNFAEYLRRTNQYPVIARSPYIIIQPRGVPKKQSL